MFCTAVKFFININCCRFVSFFEPPTPQPEVPKILKLKETFKCHSNWLETQELGYSILGPGNFWQWNAKLSFMAKKRELTVELPYLIQGKCLNLLTFLGSKFLIRMAFFVVKNKDVRDFIQFESLDLLDMNVSSFVLSFWHCRDWTRFNRQSS